MSVIILLILFSLMLAVGFLLAFIWSIKDNQLEDDYTPSVRILFDNELTGENNDNKNTKNNL
jgi:cbb3-type cytochrome oxidase maturation protein